MEIILLERIGKLGGAGDVVKVRDGYARNFLLPGKKALRATDQNKKVFEERRAEIMAQNAELKAAAEKHAEKLNGLTVPIVRQSSEEGKLYGAVTVRDIADELAAQGHDVPRSQIVLFTNIKTTGTYTARVNLHPEVACEINVQVNRSESHNG